jgi:hypothetical protein
MTLFVPKQKLQMLTGFALNKGTALAGPQQLM